MTKDRPKEGSDKNRLASFAASLVIAVLAYASVSTGAVAGGWRYLPQALLLLSVIYQIMVGAEWLVDSASGIARHLGVSELVIGLTVVAFGTSAPEMAASLSAGFQGKGDITVANVVGSNVFNLCFILGGVAILVPGGLRTERALVTRDGPVLLLGTLLLFLFIGGLSSTAAAPPVEGAWFGPLNLRLEFGEGVILLLALLLYLYALYRVLRSDVRARRERLAAASDNPVTSTESAGGPEESSVWGYVPPLCAGLIVVVAGCHVLVGHAEQVEGAVTGFGALWFARMWNIPDYVIGVTIIAAGTSAPEFIVSLVAAARRSFSISAGNLIGSDIFNMFGVVGLAGIVLQQPLAAQVTVSSAVIPSLLALSGVVLVTIFFMWTGGRISRLEGFALVLIGVGRWTMDFASR